MSGIAGLFHFDGRPVEPGRIEAMTARMAHRGPDGIAHWRDGSWALGHCMFHTTGESMLASQPLSDPSGEVVVAMDGWIANYDDLTRLLSERGARLRSRADVELVLQAYLLFGEEVGTHLEGNFAIAIWDGRARKVVCLRDIFAYKPFHYHWDGRTLSLASEVAPLLDLPWVPEELDLGTVAEFLENDWCTQEATFWRHVNKLPGAHLLVCDADGPRTREHWRFDPHAGMPVRTEEEVVGYYGEILDEAVRRAARSHRPIAFEASGGLDSSAILAVGLRLSRTGRLPAPDVMAYTFRADAFPEMNDLPYARSLARFLDIEIREMPLTQVDLEAHVERARRRRTFPGRPHFYSHLGIMKDAKARGCAVLLSGEGGDEWLSLSEGFDYQDILAAGRFGILRTTAAADIEEFGLGPTARWILRHGLAGSLPSWVRYVRRAFLRASRRGAGRHAYWISDRLVEELAPRRRERGRRIEAAHLQSRVQAILNSRFQFPARTWAFETMDQETAEMQFERRNPFDDRRIAELAFSLPGWMFRRDGLNKSFHRTAMMDLLPPDILARRDKAWFLSPGRAQTLDVLERLGNEGAARGWVRRESLATATASDLSDWYNLSDEIVRAWALFGTLAIR